ncbi:hypothetical protein [Streptosporangium sp. NPDC051022]|uniref:hypothetical protein n=1 Tax=Streptosporangium sp. NPDC051022 TaxID=3155752 RepID=UPI003442BEA1
MLHPTLTPACQPWCTDHQHAAHPEDGFCRRRAAVPFADVYLSDTDDGPRLFAHGSVVTLDELTLDQAEARFRAGLELVAAARTAVAA